MADRIFPSAEQDNLGSPKQINTIDWEKFAATLNMRIAEDEGDGEGDDDMPEPTEDGGEGEEDDMPEGDEGDEDTEADMPNAKTAGKMPVKVLEHFKQKNEDKPKSKGKGVPPQLAPFVNKKKEKTEEKEEKEGPMKRKGKDVVCEKCAGKGCKACAAKTAANTSGKIVFNSPEEISAEAITRAKQAGNETLVRAILAAREDRNRLIESKLEKLAQDESDKQQRLAQRREYRAAIVAQAENQAKRLASAEATLVDTKSDFKKVESMNATEKRVVAQRLLENGFPAEYVEATLGLNNETELTSGELQIREVMSSGLNDNTKRTAVAGLVKVAELSEEQRNRCIRFWVDELGYGDEQWVRDLFEKKS